MAAALFGIDAARRCIDAEWFCTDLKSFSIDAESFCIDVRSLPMREKSRGRDHPASPIADFSAGWRLYSDAIDLPL